MPLFPDLWPEGSQGLLGLDPWEESAFGGLDCKKGAPEFLFLSLLPLIQKITSMCLFKTISMLNK